MPTSGMLVTDQTRHLPLNMRFVCGHPFNDHNVLLDDNDPGPVKPTVLLFHPSDMAAGLHSWFREGE